jgi:LPS export ABC transporter protein LptC
MNRFRFISGGLLILVFAACSFDYGNQETADKDLPDIVMEDVEYMRMRSGEPVARFMAEQVQRFEERRIMELRSFSFEQYEKNGSEVNAYGRAGSAEFMIDSGDVRMDDGVRIEVESEDITIETKQLEWIDNAHTLTGGPNEPTAIFRANGTSFSGIGFFADARLRTWKFSGEASGSYIHDDDDDEDEESPDSGDGESPAEP